jgi:hypothetical protein
MSFTWAGSEWLKGYFKLDETFKMEVHSLWIKGVLVGLKFIRWGNSTYASNIKKFTIETPSGVLFEKERPILNFAQIYEGLGGELPLPTQMLIAVSNALRNSLPATSFPSGCQR